MGSNLIPIIKHGATPFLGLIAGLVAAMLMSAPEFSGFYEMVYNEFFMILNVFKYFVGGFICAVVAVIVKLILYWRFE